MNRTYNFQVDNGLFVAEYYIEKNYKDITTDDLKDKIELFTDMMWDYKKIDGLSFSSHLNSAIANASIKKKDKLEKQLKTLISNIGNDKTCMICGKKTVNIDLINKIPLNSLIYGVPSVGSFFNKSNNLQSIDICPICAFLSYISFLNTQKISYPFLYLSDSDKYMRDITLDIQNQVQSNILLKIKQKDIDKHFISTISNLMQDQELYNNMNYIDLIFFKNGKKNAYNKLNIQKKKIIFLLKLKNKNLITEFCKLNLFKPYLDDKFLMNLLITDNELKCSKELFNEVKEEIMSQYEIKIIEYATEKLLEKNNANDILKELKLCSKKSDFEEFVVRHSTEESIYSNLENFIKLTQGYYKYINVLKANLLLNK